MRLSLLLFGLARLLWFSARTNASFKHFIRNARVRLLIKTADNRHGRLFVFDRGKVRSYGGAGHDFDVALVWQDPGTAVSVLLQQNMEAFFYAAAAGQLRIEGMPVYAQWFDTAMSHVR